MAEMHRMNVPDTLERVVHILDPSGNGKGHLPEPQARDDRSYFINRRTMAFYLSSNDDRIEARGYQDSRGVWWTRLASENPDALKEAVAEYEKILLNMPPSEQMQQFYPD